MVGWLVVFGLTAQNISVYIGLSPREREGVVGWCHGAG